MRKVLYTKFSRERRNEFQIMTRITEEDGIRRVWSFRCRKRENSTSGICMKTIESWSICTPMRAYRSAHANWMKKNARLHFLL